MVAALVGFVSGFIDVDDPTDATSVLAIRADTAKGMIGPRLEPFYRPQHCLRIPRVGGGDSRPLSFQKFLQLLKLRLRQKYPPVSEANLIWPVQISPGRICNPPSAALALRRGEGRFRLSGSFLRRSKSYSEPGHARLCYRFANTLFSRLHPHRCRHHCYGPLGLRTAEAARNGHQEPTVTVLVHFSVNGRFER